jgi:3-hydroxyacyl-[acyl-carrier-protein] dehydratase
MLTKDFCAVENLECLPGSVKASLNWNAGHAIFAGHFPGQPVVPGVCMLQLTKELLETGLGMKLVLKESGQMKFLHFIDPKLTPSTDIIITYSETDGLYKVGGSLQKEQVIFFRFVGVFVASVADQGKI